MESEAIHSSRRGQGSRWVVEEEEEDLHTYIHPLVLVLLILPNTELIIKRENLEIKSVNQERLKIRRISGQIEPSGSDHIKSPASHSLFFVSGAEVQRNNTTIVCARATGLSVTQVVFLTGSVPAESVPSVLFSAGHRITISHLHPVCTLVD